MTSATNPYLTTSRFTSKPPFRPRTAPSRSHDQSTRMLAAERRFHQRQMDTQKGGGLTSTVAPRGFSQFCHMLWYIDFRWTSFAMTRVVSARAGMVERCDRLMQMSSEKDELCRAFVVRARPERGLLAKGRSKVKSNATTDRTSARLAAMSEAKPIACLACHSHSHSYRSLVPGEWVQFSHMSTTCHSTSHQPCPPFQTTASVSPSTG